ncbi:MAG: hypothetical protein AB8G99_06275 [Planctomycetaceae bacterium]
MLRLIGIVGGGVLSGMLAASVEVEPHFEAASIVGCATIGALVGFVVADIAETHFSEPMTPEEARAHLIATAGREPSDPTRLVSPGMSAFLTALGILITIARGCQ